MKHCLHAELLPGLSRQAISLLCTQSCLPTASYGYLLFLEFKLPEFCEITNEAEASEEPQVQSRAASRAFSLHRADVNIGQQAKKLGLKSRDVSHIFKVVTPRLVCREICYR